MFTQTHRTLRIDQAMKQKLPRPQEPAPTEAVSLYDDRRNEIFVDFTRTQYWLARILHRTQSAKYKLTMSVCLL